jgi:hypothetical protein
MLTCNIIGDSIAVGLARSMPECSSEAIGGIAADTFFYQHKMTTNANVTIISLGSNHTPYTEHYLKMLRLKIKGKVIWMLPASRNRNVIKAIANTFNDVYVDVRLGGATEIHIHPTPDGYKTLASLIRQTLE